MPRKKSNKSIDHQAEDPVKPSWDKLARTLHWRGKTIKTLRRRAEQQEAVLNAFEAAGWPEAIGDPLETDEMDDKPERLREAVKRLNDGLEPGTIRFHANGRGDGIRWEVVEARR